MQESTTREKILKRIRKALIEKTPNPYPDLDHDAPVFNNEEESDEVLFAQNLKNAGGQFIFCEDQLDLVENILTLSSELGWKKFVCTDSVIRNFLDECDF